MSRVALPELKRYGYSGGFSTATLAAGGTLGILIPPSVVLGDLCHHDRAEHREAVPGGVYSRAFLAAIGYMFAISVYVRMQPRIPQASANESATWNGCARFRMSGRF